MHKRGILMVLLLTGAMVGASAPSQAFYKDEIPAIYQTTPRGNGWTSLKMQTDGSEFVVEVYTPAVSGPSQGGVSLYDKDGKPAGAFVFTAFPATTGQYLELNNGVNNVHIDKLDDGPGGLFGLALDFNDPHYKTFKGVEQMIVWWAGRSSRWQLSVKSNGGNTIQGIDQGDHAFLYRAKDFSSTTTGEAFAMGLGAQAQLQGDLPLKIDHTLVGIYQQGLLNAGAVSYTSPKGAQSCSLAPVSQGFVAGALCFFTALDGDQAQGEGNYTFHDSSVGAGFAGSFSDVFLGGADARLPVVAG